MTSYKILQLCSQAKSKYSDQVKCHVLETLNYYRNLAPKIEKFIYDNGKEDNLLCLNGTVPIYYRKNFYNIPISIYLEKDYPYSAPFCYVRPTSTMTIKESKHVDNQGKVHVSYLTNWDQNCDLNGFIQVMIMAFSELPPVYQKPKTPYPVQPYPNSSSSASYPFSATSYPVYPNTSAAGYTPTVGQQYPSYPPYPGAGTVASSTSSGNIASLAANSGTATISNEHIRASLVSAIEDALKERLKEKIEQYDAEIEVLRKTGDDLNQGSKHLDQIIGKMERDVVAIGVAKQQMDDKHTQLMALLEKYKDEDGAVNIDDVYGPNEPLYKQLLNTFAEENSIADAIYYLSEALKKGVIDLDVFLKHVRELSRKQFLLRALMQKCRERAGLPY